MLVALAVLAPRPATAFDETRLFASVVAVIPHWKTPPVRNGHVLAPEGSGVAVLPGGWLATNVHVVRDADTAVLRFASGRLAQATVVARDARTDIALLHTDTKLPPVETAPPPPVGGKVCAVGNYFGQGISVTCGVVSALRRTDTGFNPIEDFIQTDASVNPGGSGGALVDAQGRFVGLLAAIFTKNSDADIGMNFASSAALVMRVITDLKADGKVRWADPGMRFQNLTRAERFHETGARVAEVAKDGPALAAGIEAGDVIQRIGTRPIDTAADARTAFALKRPGDRVEVVALRGKERRTATVTVGP